MACTQCASTCNCAVVAGAPWVTVTGTGSGIDPYVVTTNLCVAMSFIPYANRNIGQLDRILIQDQGGECKFVRPVPDGFFIMGNTGTPQYITGDDTITFVGTGLVTTNAQAVDTVGVTVTCESVQDCVSPMMLANGFSYDDANNQWDTTGGPGSLLTANGSGGASWSAPPVIPAAVAVSDTNSIDMSLSGSTVSGNVRTGCGLYIDGTGVRVNTFTWGWGCAVTNGAPVYCDGSGQLRTQPEHTSQEYGRAASTSPQVTIYPTDSVSGVVNITATNPSTCRSATWMSGSSVNGTSTANSPAFGSGRCLVTGQMTFGGGGLSLEFALAEWDPGACAANASFGFGNTSGISDTGVVAAGGTYSHSLVGRTKNMSGIGFAAICAAASAIILVTR